jgi:O-antigen/teichoic acid export membrane protein
VVFAAALLFCLISLPLAEPAVILLFGSEFVGAVPAFIALLPGIAAMSVNTIFMNYFASTGMPVFVVYSPLAATILNFILNFFWIPQKGITGAALSSVASYSLMLFLSVCYFYLEGKFDEK